MRMYFIVVLLLFSSILSAKDDPKYPVSAITEELKKGMYGVIRTQEIRYEINDKASATEYHHIVITILNPNGKSLAWMNVNYDKFTSVKSFKGVVYDANGEVIKKLKQSEIADRSHYDGSLFSDSRYKYADLSQGTYPYTVEFEYELSEKGVYEIPDFYLYDDDEVSTEFQTYAIYYPKNLAPRYKLFKIEEPKQGTDPNGREYLLWTFKNFLPSKFEVMSPETSRSVPSIKIAPNEFEYGGQAGKMDNWENYGKWFIELNRDRDALPEETKTKIKSLTQNAATIEEKARIVYEFVQGKTRYVNISLGIGGLQPFDATTVDRTGYGDCKGLSNYTLSLLKTVGVKGYYALVFGGESQPVVDQSFASHQWNHAIVAVPNEKDTIWLECTSQTSPFGYSGRFTGDRHAMLITETGGKLVRTTIYPTELNVQSRTATVKISETGDAFANTTTRYKGLQYENDGLSFVVNYPPDEQKKWVLKNVQIPIFDVTSYKFTNKKSRIPVATLDLDLSLKKLANVSGKRMFVTPNLMNRMTFIPEKNDKRHAPIVSRMGSVDLDSIHYVLPDGIYPEFLPQPVSVKSKFGEYEASFKVDEKGLLYVRRLRINKGEFPAESYQEFSDFYRNINKADNIKVVFVNKT